MNENPFASPQTSGSEAESAKPVVYVPLQSRATWAMVGCGLLMLFSVVQIVICSTYQPPTDRYVQFNAATIQEVLNPPLVSIPFMIAIYVALIAELMFFYRAHKNLQPLDTIGHTFSPGWGIVTFFIPLVSFIGPPLFVREIWRASDPANPIDHPTDWKENKTDGIVLCFMAFMVIPGIAGFYNGYRVMTVNSKETLLDVLTFTLFLNLVALVGQSVQIAIIRGISLRQKQRFEAISQPIAIDG